MASFEYTGGPYTKTYSVQSGDTIKQPIPKASIPGLGGVYMLITASGNVGSFNLNVKADLCTTTSCSGSWTLKPPGLPLTILNQNFQFPGLCPASSSGDDDNTGLIVGIVVAVLVLLLVGAVVGIYFMYFKTDPTGATAPSWLACFAPFFGFICCAASTDAASAEKSHEQPGAKPPEKHTGCSAPAVEQPGAELGLKEEPLPEYTAAPQRACC